MAKFFAGLGPGVITGAADDDPSGIATYTVAGAAFGYTSLWTAVVSIPLMVSVQLMCARLGLVTGQGLASVIRSRYPPAVLWLCCTLLVVANVVNIGADLAGMADATELITGLSSSWCTVIYAGAITWLMVRSSYRVIARIFKWFTAALLAYIFAALLARPDLRVVLESTLMPRVEWSGAYMATLVAILGTTISPYLFFWQAAEEVEESHALSDIPNAIDESLAVARTDVITGMVFSNLVMYFIVMTAAATLNASGQREIATAGQAAEALRPLAGDGAYYLFTLGIVGAGMLGVPVLAGSSAYAIAEGANWKGSLDQPPALARGFYGVIVAAILIGLFIDLLGFSAIPMLYWSAVLNGVLAPPLIVVIVLLTQDTEVMGHHVNPPWLSGLGWATAAIMSAVVGVMLAGWMGWL